MAKAKRVKQLNFTIPNKAGLLSEITTAVTGGKAYEPVNGKYCSLIQWFLFSIRQLLALA